MAIYLNGQLVAGTNDGLKSAETVEQAKTVEQAETVTKAKTVEQATTVGEYTGHLEIIDNPGWTFDSSELDSQKIYIQPMNDIIKLYAYGKQDINNWFCFTITGGEEL